MTPDQKMEKYLYKAYAIALRGSIRKPYFQNLGNHLAISTYAGSRGKTECSHHDFAVGEDIRYKVARTRIEAGESKGIYKSTLIAQVEGLQIGKRLSVDEVTCSLTSVYDSKNYPKNCLPRILPTGSTIRNLRVDGRIQDLLMPPAFHAGGETHQSFFRGERDEDSTLQPGPMPEPIHVPDLGTIYYAEWSWVHPNERHQQRLTMLRLALGSDFGGDVDVGVGHSDGTGWPPGVVSS
jgi:hypothetical protein